MKKILKAMFLMMTLAISQTAMAEVIYRATTTIGEHRFEDLIVLQQKPTAAGARTNQRIAGSVTVPGIFSVPFDGVITQTWVQDTEHPHLRFRIMARENGAETPVHYSLAIHEGGDRLTGLLVSLDPDHPFRGTVEAVKIFEE